MAILPKMTAGQTWSGPALQDDEVRAALVAALGASADAAAAEYMRTGEWPSVPLPPGGQHFTIRTLSAAEVAEAAEAAGREPAAWGWYQREIAAAVQAEVDAVFLPEGQPPEPDAPPTVRPYPLMEPGERPDSPELVARRLAWHAARADLQGRLSHRALALAPPEVLDALEAHTAWRTRAALERVTRALVSTTPAWFPDKVEVTPGLWRLFLTDLGIAADGGGDGARLIHEIDAHLTREGGRRPKA